MVAEQCLCCSLDPEPHVLEVVDGGRQLAYLATRLDCIECVLLRDRFPLAVESRRKLRRRKL